MEYSELSAGVLMAGHGESTFSVTSSVTQVALRVRIEALRARSELSLLELEPHQAFEAERPLSEVGAATSVEVFAAPSRTWREHRPEQASFGGGPLELVFAGMPGRRDPRLVRESLAVARFEKRGETWSATSPFLPLVVAVGAHREVHAAVLDLAMLAAVVRDKYRRRRALAAAAHRLSSRLRRADLSALTVLQEVDAFVGTARLMLGEPAPRGARLTLDGQVELTRLFQRAREQIVDAISGVGELDDS